MYPNQNYLHSSTLVLIYGRIYMLKGFQNKDHQEHDKKGPSLFFSIRIEKLLGSLGRYLKMLKIFKINKILSSRAYYLPTVQSIPIAKCLD